MKNPLDIAYSALVKTVLLNPQVREHLRIGNLIIFGENDADPEKRTIAPGDLPEIVIHLTGFSGNLHQNSSGNKLTLSYRFDVSTGSFDSRIINALIFNIWIALLNWKNSLHEQKFEGVSFIKDVRVNASPVGVSDEEKNRQIKGWATMFALEMDLYFTTATLLSLAKVESG